MKRVWSRSSTPWRSTGSNARGGAGRGRATAIGRRPRYSEARERPNTRHAGAAPNVDVASSTALINRPRRSRTVSGGSVGALKLFLEREQRLSLLHPHGVPQLL